MIVKYFKPIMYKAYNLKKQIKEEISMIIDDEACQPMWHHLQNLCMQYNKVCKVNQSHLYS